MIASIVPGVEGRKESVVTNATLATVIGSGLVDVYATPAMIALMEQTAMESVAHMLPETMVTVGTEVIVKHIKATLPGRSVCCFSKLILTEGNKLVFEVYVNDESGLIGKGTHTRYIVDKKAFISNLTGK